SERRSIRRLFGDFDRSLQIRVREGARGGLLRPDRDVAEAAGGEVECAAVVAFRMRELPVGGYRTLHDSIGAPTTYLHAFRAAIGQTERMREVRFRLCQRLGRLAGPAKWRPTLRIGRKRERRASRVRIRNGHLLDDERAASGKLHLGRTNDVLKIRVRRAATP